MYEVEFYYDSNNISEVVDYLDGLKEKGETSKTSVSTAISPCVNNSVEIIRDTHRSADCKAY